MREGYIKLFRKMTEWEWYDDINTSRLFIHLLLTANWCDVNWKGIAIKRGQKLTSLNQLSAESRLSVQQVKTALKNLKKTNEITSTSTNKYRLITLVKYDDYQTLDKQDNKPSNKQTNKRLTNKQQSANKQSTTNKELKELKEEKEVKEENPIPLLSSFKNFQKLNLFELFETEFKRPLSQREMQLIFEWNDEHGAQLVIYALRESVIYDKMNFDYIGKILNEWKRKGTTVSKYEESER